ncbi:hypothetical protein ABVT39_012693 [Epinephelus coioides]
MIVANTVFKDEKNGPDAISTLSDVQLGASTMVRRMSAMSENLTEQLDRDLAKCRWFSIQCDESMDSTSTAQLMMFIRMAFDDFSTKEELLTLLPLKTTMRGIDIYNTVKSYFVEKKSVLNDNASASAAFDKVVEKYSQVINRLRQEFENRFCDFDQLETCVSFVSNPFIKNNPETPVGPVPVSQTSDDDSSEDESAGDVAVPKKPKPYHFRQEWLTEFTWLRVKLKKVMSCMYCSHCGPKFAGKTKFADSTTNFKHETLVKHNNSIRHKNAPYVSFMIDGDTDNSTKECEIIYGRILDQGRPVNILIGHVEVQHAHAQGIYDATKKAFSHLGTETSWMEKTVAMGADGAAVNLGHKGGVIALLQAEIKKMLEDGTFVAFCHFLADLFDAISKFSLLLQRNDVILPQGVTIKGEAAGLAEDSTASTHKLQQAVRTTVECSVQHLRQRFGNEDLTPSATAKAVRSFKIFSHDSWPEQRDQLIDYCGEELDFLLDHFSTVLTRNGCDINLAGEEYQSMKMFINILHLVNIMLVLHVSSAVCERGFSAQRRIKSDVRGSLHVDTVEDLIRISLDGPSLEEFDAKEAVQMWFSQSKRARRPNYKGWPTEVPSHSGPQEVEF